MINFENKKVLFIDLDGTLIKTVSGKTFPEDITDFRIQFSVLDKIIEKLPNLKQFCIITNQGGIGKFVTKEDFELKLFCIKQFCSDYLKRKINLCFYGSYYCASIDKNNPNRKPNTGLLEQACANYNVAKSDMIMIGDASGKPGDFSDSDKKCAENFDIDYIDVRDFLEL